MHRLRFLHERVTALRLKTLLIAGLIPRLLLMPFFAHPYDMWFWYRYSMRVIVDGVNILKIPDIAPLWYFTLVPIAYVYDYFSKLTGLKAMPVESLPPNLNPQWGIEYIPGPLFNTLVKIPLLIADVATAVFLYKLVAEHCGSEGMARKVAMLFYLNPALVWVSCAWGQFDSIPLFFVVLSIYLLLKSKIVLSSLSIAVATLFKLYSIGFLIPASIYLIRDRQSRGNERDLLKFFLVFTFVFLLFELPLMSNLLTFMSRSYASSLSTNTFRGIFGFGLTYWSISMLFPLDPKAFIAVSNIFMIVLLFVSIRYALRASFNDGLRGLALTSFLIVSSVFLSYRYVSEARFVWLIPFLALMIIGGIISERIYSLASLTAFLYVQKNFPYYLLPVATLNQEVLNTLFKSINSYGKVVQGALVPTPLSVTILAALGITFSILILMMYTNTLHSIRKISRKPIENMPVKSPKLNRSPFKYVRPEKKPSGSGA